jgi:succinyl-CoA synthetase alpha subunit
MNAARGDHTATLLNSGKVLVAGGRANNGTNFLTLASAELYDPTTGSFTLTGNLNTSRELHAATLLNNGTVLIVGGFSTTVALFLGSAELYQPTIGTFASTASLNVNDGRTFLKATSLNTGAVLVAGGSNTQAVAIAELYELVVVSPTSLSFAGQAVDTTSVSQTVILTNN